jgi:ActR/RegA family two-component response regulator
MPTSAIAFHTLIVEDDPSSSDVIARAIRRVHVEPIVAMTVGQALVHIDEQWPPAVVLDLRLPDADGTVLLRRLKRDARKTHIAVVTGVADLSRYADLMHFPPDLMLKKPVDIAKLLNWLRQARAEYVGVQAAAAAAAAGAEPPAQVEELPATLPSVSAFIDRTQRRREARFAAERNVWVRAVNDESAPAYEARLLNASSRGIASIQSAPMRDGDWFTMTIGGGVEGTASRGATVAIYLARDSVALPSGAYRVGAELVGFVSGPDDDPGQLLAALLADGL